MADSDKRAIVLVAYGTLNPAARTTYDRMVAAYREMFPGFEVRLAFTSGHLRRRISRSGAFIDNPLTALAALQDQGFRQVVVQSLHIVPGSEFHQVTGLVRALDAVKGRFGFQGLELGLPLLSYPEDYRRVSCSLHPLLDRITDQGETRTAPRNPREEAVVLMGHGTEHSADSGYSRLARVLEQDYQNVFLGTLDGYPGLEEVLAMAKRSGVQKVRLLPFMVVAGSHAQNDLAGGGNESWKSTFEGAGFSTRVCLEGLGEEEGIVRIFGDHTKKALEKLSSR
ncbi:MAG: cobalt chelatase [Methanosarcinales archaeon]|nr:cobalt chelatase [Methanosarcinales archaeon]